MRSLLVFAAIFLATSANAQVRCFKDTRLGWTFMIDYGRSLVRWYVNTWTPAEITETSIRWQQRMTHKTASFYFDRYTFKATERNKFDEDVNAEDYVNEYTFLKVECPNKGPPPDAQ
jgi:hypothetical protein